MILAPLRHLFSDNGKSIDETSRIFTESLEIHENGFEALNKRSYIMVIHSLVFCLRPSFALAAVTKSFGLTLTLLFHRDNRNITHVNFQTLVKVFSKLLGKIGRNSSFYEINRIYRRELRLLLN